MVSGSPQDLGPYPMNGLFWPKRSNSNVKFHFKWSPQATDPDGPWRILSLFPPHRN